MADLITITDIQPIRQISSNVDTAKFNPYITESELLDIKPFLGEQFYVAVSNGVQASTAEYLTLKNGGDYTYNGNLVRFAGLKVAHAYYAYSRYIMQSNIHSTPFGMKQKINEFSNTPQERELKMMSDQARMSAAKVMYEVELFLNRNSSDYPLWKCTDNTPRTGAPRIRVVG